jgi:hypothetical protein
MLMPRDIVPGTELTNAEFSEFIHLRDRNWNASTEGAATKHAFTAAAEHLEFLQWLQHAEMAGEDPRIAARYDAEFTALRAENWGRTEEMAAERRETGEAVKHLVKLRELNS